MCNPGTKEGVTVKEGRFAGVWPANESFFKSIRGKGGLIGVAVDPLTAHECGNQRYLAIPWLDACLSARLPDKTGEALKAMPVNDVWLAPLLSTAGRNRSVASDQSRRGSGAGRGTRLGHGPYGGHNQRPPADGDRSNRKRARLKYLIEKRGLPGFLQDVEAVLGWLEGRAASTPSGLPE